MERESIRPAAAAPLTTALADRYRIERELGVGGMATVYLAADLKHDRKVAIKVIHAELAASVGAQRFLSEIKTTANLQHPHILPLYDSGEAAGLLFYVMPYVAGESLRERLRRQKPLPVDDAIRITRQVASALDYAHRHGIVHRDVKPGNILLHDGSALVTDFGIALAIQSAGEERLTQTGVSIGTPEYMSPEQAMGDKRIAATTDVYSLGVVLYEMLTGDPPFSASTAQGVVAKVISALPESVALLRKSTPPHVAAALHRALEKLPADRFPTSQSFADALAATQVEVSRAAAVRHGEPSSNWRTVLRHPLVGAIAIVAIAAIAFAAWQWRRSSQFAPNPTQRFTVDLPPNVHARGWSDLAISPDGSALVFSATDSDGIARLFLRRLDDLRAKPIAGTDGAAQTFFSPDGRWVAFWAAGRLMKVELPGSTPQPIGDFGEITGGAWTREGVIVVGVNGRLYSFPAADATRRRMLPLDSTRGETGQFYPTASDGNDHVVYASWGAGGLENVRLGILTVSTGQTRRVDLPITSPVGMVDGTVIFGTIAGDLTAVRLDLSSATVMGAAAPVADGVGLGYRLLTKATVSRSGTLVYATSASQSQLVLADAAGETSLLPDARGYGFPRYSPDGKRLVFSISSGATSDVWVFDLATRDLQRLSSGGSVNERPEWTIDGTRVMYRSDRGGRSAIWWQPVDQSARPTRLLADTTTGYFEAVMTPDGRAVVYHVARASEDIFSRALEGDTTPRPLSVTPFREMMARVSPDGRLLAFTIDEGMRQVAVQRFPGSGPRLQVSRAGGSEPVWAPDGRLFYRSNGRFFVASIATVPTLRVASNSVFMDDNFLPFTSPHANYDVTPDGKRLLVVKGEPSRLTVVTNWWSEVRSHLRSDGQR